ncbi:MAG TPA: hypothetical protein H9866_07395 [Candidatus Tidjanibacter gallistercoris]|nr:hypothetical protein [Candidatus Tidjanibacter gallistercoris]
MKKMLLLFAAIALALPQAAAQEELSADQRALRTELYDFLKREGYVPEIDGDGDIAFKVQGDTHWITVSAVDDSPYYVTIMRGAPYIEDYDYDRVLHAADELNLYKTAKVEAYDDFAVIKSSMYLRRASAFEDVFDKLLEVMDDVYEDFVPEYKNARLCGE